MMLAAADEQQRQAVARIRGGLCRYRAIDDSQFCKHVFVAEIQPVWPVGFPRLGRCGTVLENVTMPLELIGEPLSLAEEKARALLEQVGLSDRWNTFPDRLSGGEQQRVAIARALAHDPLLVLADEPTGNLDEETSEQVLHLLDKLTRQAGKNLILVTHSRENTVFANRVIELREGCFVEAE